MGGGTWSADTYRSAVRGRDAFAFSDDVLRRSREERECHQMLNPFGLVIRESRDSAEHPQSNAIMVGLDVTGSMARVVVDIRDSLGAFMDMVLNGRYIEDPQVLFYAVGDAKCDAIPFQVSQFESDNRINDQLTKVVLEGGGGGGLTESYEFGFYCAARFTSIDCFEKRNKKGYLFSIGDELPDPQVERRATKRVFDSDLQADVPLEEVVRETQEKFFTFHIIPKGSNHYDNPAVRNTWARILGGDQFVFMLEDPRATAETIALAIGLNEGATTLEEGLKVVAENSGQGVVSAVGRALGDFARYIESMPPRRRASAGSGRRSTPSKEEEGEVSKEGKDKEDWKL